MHNAHTSNALYAKRLSIWLLVVALDKSSSTLNTAYSLSFRACGSIWFQLGESTTTTIWCLAIFLSLIFTAIELAGREYTHTHTSQSITGGLAERRRTMTTNRRKCHTAAITHKRDAVLYSGALFQVFEYFWKRKKEYRTSNAVQRIQMNGAHLNDALLSSSLLFVASYRGVVVCVNIFGPHTHSTSNRFDPMNQQWRSDNFMEMRNNWKVGLVSRHHNPCVD